MPMHWREFLIHLTLRPSMPPPARPAASLDNYPSERTARQGNGKAGRFLTDLADAARPPINSRSVMLVVAHPDDETIGLGGQLRRLTGIRIVHVTDGAPRSGSDALDRGFSSPADYAATRREELRRAMGLAGIPPTALTSFDVPDQGATAALAQIAQRLAAMMNADRIDVVLTHAFEGGHPDHDACAFAVQAACSLVAARGGLRPQVVEMPYYALAPDGSWRIQAFAEADPDDVTIDLGPAERRAKQAMLDAHATQRSVLALLPPGPERFRISRGHDFTRPPNGGALIYERQHWGMTFPLWRDAVSAARRELGVEACP
ncbi:PIG-L deacetylase family protein [Salinarimonas soli]|uniref:PIG-L family deacetylase n=1 Tax=Salinarimonas soli TaxID=1638099 RepID=A0A5B2VS83_9HYPH|nr:PIG-L deacetylase family protein [Salinarimonas soli]KAA2241102.1 PIG-L family deacetylase [Salinarimonas soli]